jgi:hypothetical protein
LQVSDFQFGNWKLNGAVTVEGDRFKSDGTLYLQEKYCIYSCKKQRLYMAQVIENMITYRIR